MQRTRLLSCLVILIVLLSACGDESNPNTDNSQPSTVLPATLAELKPTRPANLVTARVATVIDGDSVELEGGRRVRLIGINAPESDQYLYDEATAFARDLLQGKEVGLEAGSEPLDQFERELFYLWVGDKLANWEIVRAGYANRYAVPPNIQYDAYIERAEEHAVLDGLGIWQSVVTGLEIVTVVSDAPGRDEENLNGEYVQIANRTSADIDLTGFTVFDTSRNTFTFENVIVRANQRVNVYSGCGQGNSTTIYWCSSAPVWNNNGDTAFLSDAQGHYIDHYVIAGQ